MMRRNGTKKLDSTPFYCLLGKDDDSPRTLGTWAHVTGIDSLPVENSGMTGPSTDLKGTKKGSVKKRGRTEWARDLLPRRVENPNISETHGGKTRSFVFGIMSCALIFAVLRVAYT
jgi:hypothetical protein